MIYTIPYQTEELLKDSYFTLRNNIDPELDSIHLAVRYSEMEDNNKEDFYLKMLKLEGMFRSEIGIR